MGNNRWRGAEYSSYTKSIKTKSREQVFTSRTIKNDLDPTKIQFRESRDSEANPVSNAIIIGLDVTGSMGFIPEALVKNYLGVFVDLILQRKPITDPHLMFMGIGDCTQSDKFPLQVTQFEADNVIIPQLTDIFLEGRGGGNSFESYELPWAFAAFKTKIDCWEKREKKGYIFTIGDEFFPESTSTAYLKKIFPDDVRQDMTPEDLYELASKRYNIFHLVVKEGSFARTNTTSVVDNWFKKIGKRVLLLTDHTKIAEVIVSAIAVSEGDDPEETAGSWDNETSSVVREALGI